MEKLLRNLNVLVKLQNVILGYLAILVIGMLVLWISPDKKIIMDIYTPVFFSMFLFIPFALFLLVFALLNFSRLSKTGLGLNRKLVFASWASVFVGVYTLGYFAFRNPIDTWAFLISHELEMAFQAAPVFFGLILLGIHVVLTRQALRLVEKTL